MRAYLIVRPQSAVALDAALASRADALVIEPDEIDSAALAASIGNARFRADRPRLFIRVQAVDGQAIEAEVSAAMPLQPGAILLPVRHGRDIAHLGALLAVHEAENGWQDGATRIIALIAGTVGALNVASLPQASPRLIGIGWDAGTIAAELRLRSLYEADSWGPPLAHVRSLVRLTAAVAGVEAIEAAYLSDTGFDRYVTAAYRDGFDAVFAPSPSQVALIREA